MAMQMVVKAPIWLAENVERVVGGLQQDTVTE